LFNNYFKNINLKERQIIGLPGASRYLGPALGLDITFLGSNTAWICRQMTMFPRKALPPFRIHFYLQDQTTFLPTKEATEYTFSACTGLKSSF